MLITSKLPNTGTTIFTVMSALARDHGALNLSQGFPEFDCDEKLKELVSSHMSKGHNQYAPMPGLPALCEALSAKKLRCYGAEVDPYQEITITAGGTQAIYTALTAVLNPGDEAILFDPAYDCYDPAIALAGARPVHIPLTYPDFKIDWDLVRSKLTANTRLIIINTPHNPSGTVLTNEDLDELERICEAHDILLLSDEVYEHIIFDDAPHASILTRESLYRRAFVVYSFGKTFHATGWKMGYCVAPPELTKEFRKVHQFVVFSCNTPVQHGLAEYLQDESSYEGLRSFYQTKRDLFIEGIRNSRFKPLPCHGTYFILLDYSNISDMQDTEFAHRLTIEEKIASIPTSVFYEENPNPKVLRFCFAKEDDTLVKAGEMLCQI